MSDHRKPLTVTLKPCYDSHGIIESIAARGICEDVTLFENVQFISLERVLHYFDSAWNHRYRVILNIPREIRRTQ